MDAPIFFLCLLAGVLGGMTGFCAFLGPRSRRIEAPPGPPAPPTLPVTMTPAPRKVDDGAELVGAVLVGLGLLTLLAIIARSAGGKNPSLKEPPPFPPELPKGKSP